MERIYKTIDLCAGIGGIRRGYELAGCFENVLSAEIDKNACLTYKHLFGDDAANDITTESFKEAVKKQNMTYCLPDFHVRHSAEQGSRQDFLIRQEALCFLILLK